MTTWYQSTRRFSEAESLYREALAGLRATLGGDHRTTLTMIDRLVSALLDQGKRAEAEPFCLEALAARRAKLGEGHEDTLQTAIYLASLLQARGAFEEAAALLEQAAERARELPVGSPAFVRENRLKLRDLYRAWHIVEPSAGHDARADELEDELRW